MQVSHMGNRDLRLEPSSAVSKDASAGRLIGSGSTRMQVSALIVDAVV